jgi:hypothetical protein
MSETLTVTQEALVISEQDLPFALQFLQIIPEADLSEIEGHYNPKLKVWQYDNQDSKEKFPLTSFPTGEMPSTTCTVPTRISPTTVQTDRGVDD